MISYLVLHIPTGQATVINVKKSLLKISEKTLANLCYYYWEKNRETCDDVCENDKYCPWRWQNSKIYQEEFEIIKLCQKQ